MAWSAFKFKFRLNLIETIFKILCIVGFHIHVVFICMIYFHYPTTTKLMMLEVESAYTPSYAVCIPFLDVMENKSDNEISSGDITSQLQGKIHTLSTAEIMDMTPAATEAIVKCAFRDDLDLELGHYDAPGCYKWFFIDKFILSEFICYRVQRRAFQNITINNIVNSLHDSLEIYSFDLSPRFNAADFIKTIVYTSDVPYNDSHTYPYYSRTYASTVKRLASKEGKKPFTNSYFSRYTLTEISLQPPPYDTMCYYGPSRSSCLGRCMINKFKKLKRTPPMEILIKPSNLIHFSSQDYKNSTTRGAAIQANSECEHQCRLQSCNTDYSITTTYGYLDKDNDPNLRFRLGSPAAPMTVVTALIKLDITEFLIYLSSCFGIWFGVSIFSMNPLRIKPIVQDKISNKKKSNEKREKRRDLQESIQRLSHRNRLSPVEVASHVLKTVPDSGQSSGQSNSNINSYYGVHFYNDIQVSREDRKKTSNNKHNYIRCPWIRLPQPNRSHSLH